MATRELAERDKSAVAGSALGALGSAAVAILASLCCAGPALIAVIGAGGAVAAAGLAPYRPYFLAVSFALLGYGFWRSYRPRKEADGAACDLGTGRRIRAILWSSLAVTAISVALPLWLE